MCPIRSTLSLETRVWAFECFLIVYYSSDTLWRLGVKSLIYLNLCLKDASIKNRRPELYLFLRFVKNVHPNKADAEICGKK